MLKRRKISFISCRYESPESMTIQVSTKVCSFGKQVVEKVETEYARYQDGRYVYKLDRSPMCEYMVNFIRKLKNHEELFVFFEVLLNIVLSKPRSCDCSVQIPHSDFETIFFIVRCW